MTRSRVRGAVASALLLTAVAVAAPAPVRRWPPAPPRPRPTGSGAPPAPSGTDMARFARGKHTYARELARLEKALAEAAALRRDGDRLAVLCHYPPAVPGRAASAFTEHIDAAAADWCVFGHLHNPGEWHAVRAGLAARGGGTRYTLVGCDALAMTTAVLDGEALTRAA